MGVMNNWWCEIMMSGWDYDCTIMMDDYSEDWDDGMSNWNWGDGSWGYRNVVSDWSGRH